MNKSHFKINILMKMMYFSLINTPIPMNISLWWNFGSILGLSLMIQILSGLFLSMHYCPSTMLAFNSIIHIMQDVNYGWIMRFIHMNGASMYFICMYIHMGRGMYYHSFHNTSTWIMGVIILMLSMATAFVGYVLPWGQMSFWGATVITNLMSAIPYLGKMIVFWLWGGFSIDNATLNRFFSIHFILPLIISIFVLIHLLFLHEKLSNNPLGLKNTSMISFHPIFTYKDLIGMSIFMMILMMICLQNPYMLSDPDNYSPANMMITPKHIQPEWYFLFAYAILRSIPSKLGGVVALLMSILIIMIMPFFSPNYKFMSSKFYPTSQLLFWMFINSFIMLTWAGAQMIEYPYVMISQIYTIMYFSFFFLYPIINNKWDMILKL
uniref:Cytochrome b n=1 Tax=Ammophila sabulosa TaxID=1088610 RepID=A0A7L7S5V7_9HYME|nr:cytochrome b [Ammophila sabulosa]